MTWSIRSNNNTEYIIRNNNGLELLEEGLHPAGRGKPCREPVVAVFSWLLAACCLLFVRWAVSTGKEASAAPP